MGDAEWQRLHTVRIIHFILSRNVAKSEDHLSLIVELPQEHHHGR